MLLCEDGTWAAVEDLLDTGGWETVYNLRVANYHTYFVGCDEWGFSVWAHNAECNPQQVRAAVEDVLGAGRHFENRPGLAKKVAAEISKGTIEGRAAALKELDKVPNVGPKRAEQIVESLELRIARKDQTSSGYRPDNWETTTLHPGEKVYGGVPGQSAYYTTLDTITKSGLNAEVLFKSLQVKPHPVFGYRPRIQEYVVQTELRVPTGTVAANPLLGPGGGQQYFIHTFGDTVLKPGTLTDLLK